VAKIRYDMSQYYPLKAVLEQILGKATYRRLKETSDLKDWRGETARLLEAIQLSVTDTVQVADHEWYREMGETIEHGSKLLASSKSIDELLASLAATLTRLVFLQLGFVPLRRHQDRAVLRKGNWRLDGHRSVQFVQTEQQKQNLATFLFKRRGAANVDC